MRHLRQLGLGRDGMETLISIESQALVHMLKTKCQSSEVHKQDFILNLILNLIN